MTQEEKKIIFAYAENDMDASKVARNIHFHRNTILYHFKKIEEKYGLNPRNFYDLVVLVELAKHSE